MDNECMTDDSGGARMGRWLQNGSNGKLYPTDHPSPSPPAMSTTTARPIEFDQPEPLRFLPEGPVAIGPDQISWVAIQHAADATVGSLNLLDLNTHQNQSHDLPGRPGFAFPTGQTGVFVAGVERTIGLFNTGDGSWRSLAEGVDADVDNTIINDGVVVGDNLIFGCKDLEFQTKKAGLYLYRGRDQRLLRLRDDQICSNGKAILRHDGDTVEFLDIDSPARTIVRYELDIASGELSSGQVVVDFDGDPAVPDGQILAPDGRHTIVAMFHPEAADHGETRMIEIATGDVVHTWITPGSPQNTCPTLVSTSDGPRLVITTAVENLDPAGRDRCPQAGRLFIAPTPFDSVPFEPVDPSSTFVPRK